MTTSRLFSLAVGCALFATSGTWAQEEVIWDLPPSHDVETFVDQQFPDFPGFSTYNVAYVEITRKTQLFKVTTYYSNFMSALYPISIVRKQPHDIPNEHRCICVDRR